MILKVALRRTNSRHWSRYVKIQSARGRSDGVRRDLFWESIAAGCDERFEVRAPDPTWASRISSTPRFASRT